MLKLKAPSTLVAAGLIKLKKTLAVTCTTFQFWSLFTLVAGGVIVRLPGEMRLSRVWILSTGWARLAPAEVEAAGDTQLPQPCDPTQALFIRDEQIILQVKPSKIQNTSYNAYERGRKSIDDIILV